VAAIATLLLLISLGLPWFSLGSFGVGIGLSVNAFYHGWMYLTLLVALAALAYLVARAVWAGLRPPLPHAQVLLIATGLDLLLTVICFAAKPGGTAWSVGAYLGLLAALAAVVGAFMRRSEPEMLPAGTMPQARPVAWSPAWPDQRPATFSPPVAPVTTTAAPPPAAVAPQATAPGEVPVEATTDGEPAPDTPAALPGVVRETAAAGPEAAVPDVPEELRVTIVCSHCGHANSTDSRFCFACGQALATTGEPATSPLPPLPPIIQTASSSDAQPPSEASVSPDVVIAEDALTDSEASMLDSTAEVRATVDCPHCGQINPVANRFCYACGKALTITEEPAKSDEPA
jgi:hypothetical protein